MKILVVGKGGREHALAWASKRSPNVEKVYIAPGSPAMLDVAELVNIADTDINALADFAVSEGIDLTVVGPEHVLALGIANEFAKRGLKIFAPTKEAARIESSKDFAKELMDKYDVPTAKYQSFCERDDAKAYVQKMGAPIVIKEDGLRAGKGVVVAMDMETALNTLDEVFKEDNKVVIEECLFGEEFSLMAFVNGENVYPMEIARDHKRAYDGDEGPNTGGMGAFSPVPNVPNSIIEETMERVMRPIAKGMVKEGIPFVGFLYGGLMLTKDGVKTIEFNARFGDPECEVILSRLESDFAKVMLDVLDGKTPQLKWSEKSALGVVMASEGYPATSTVGAKISGVDKVDALVFHMGTTIKGEELQTNGGRVLIAVALEDDLKAAYDKVYGEIGKIESDKLFYRSDIGKSVL